VRQFIVSSRTPALACLAPGLPRRAVVVLDALGAELLVPAVLPPPALTTRAAYTRPPDLAAPCRPDL
jgi:hypothetical protein